MENNAQIILCNENVEERKRIVEFLTKSGFHYIDEAIGGESAIDRLLSGSYDVAILDLWTSGVDGIGIIRTISSSGIKHKPAFILTSPINKQSVLPRNTAERFTL